MVIDSSIPFRQTPVNVLEYSRGVDAGQRNRANALSLRTGEAQEKARGAQAIAQGVLSSDNPAESYPIALEQARRMGHNVASLPPEWGADADLALRMITAPEKDRTEFERLTAGLDPASARRALMVKLGIEPDANTSARLGATSGRESALEARARAAGLEPGTEPYKNFMLKGGAGKGSRIVYGPDGAPIVYEGDPAGAPKPLREFDAKALQFYTRMKQSLPRVEGAEAALIGENGGPSLLDTFADNFGSAGNFMKSSEYQTYQTAAREWIAGILRLDSGAAVPESEFTRYFATYFFSPGDNEQTRAAKKAARETAMDALLKIQPPGREGPTESAPAADRPISDYSDEELQRMLEEN